MSCEKQERSIELPIITGTASLQINMGELYENQFFLSIETPKIVHSSNIDSWDLALQANTSDKAIYLNGGKSIAALNTQKTNIAQVTMADTVLNRWKYDASNMLPDSTAIGKWYLDTKLSKEEVYILRLNNSTYKKIKIISATDSNYHLQIANIADTTFTDQYITKDPTRNLVYYSFTTAAQVYNIEPPKDTWDILITRYGTTFYDQSPPLHYVVTGALLNGTNTQAAKDTTHDFYAIDAAFCNAVTFSNIADIIGYNWKTFDFNTNTYIVNKKYNYLIKTQNNHIYKLRFLDYYSSTGVKGSPKFEFGRIR